jgi:integrative and conjugative element protein (TIGR02256 family)
MPGLVFTSPDGQFVARLGTRRLRSLDRYRGRAGARETGGILIGRYSASHTTAIIERVTGPPPDSKAGSTWFHRGVLGLQALLDRLWTREETHYLGEWHYHPAIDTEPSGQDFTQLRTIAMSPPYNCPEPLLLIVGKGARVETSLRIFVVRAHERPVELIR